MNEWRTVANDYLELTKPRICLLALAMSALGFFLGSAGPVRLMALGPLLLGLALVGAGCGALNQFLEREIDARMWRTMNRPLPAGRLLPHQALIFGFACAFSGELVLLFATNAITAVLAALTFFFYLAVYTPSKRLTSMSTLIGAIPGALPPLMGFTAAHGSLAAEGMLLFTILLLWQIPHFLAIAWLYREDYARAELPILSVIDEEGIATAKQVILYSVVLLPLTLLPSIWGVTGPIYFVGAMVLGLSLLGFGASWSLQRSKVCARRLFLASIFYLPVLGLLMVWDRTL